MASTLRNGFLAGGNFIVDTVKIIDAWPEQDALASIRETDVGIEGCSARSNPQGPGKTITNTVRPNRVSERKKQVANNLHKKAR